MRISDRYERFTDRVSTTKTNAATSKDTSKTGTTQQATTSNDGVLSVSVSPQAKELAAGTARLEQLRDQVRNGTFKVDAKDIANKLVGGDD